MITAIDTSVLLDVLANDPVHGGSSLAVLRNAAAQRRGGRLVTRDRGFYRRYFADLHIIEASGNE